MKIAVINFSGNVGKSTVARHLLAPRLPGAEVIAIESANADDEEREQALRGRQFAELQEYLQTVDTAVVDIGASNVEELLSLMHRYRGSHEDFDCFVVPTVSAFKQQKDTLATLVELHRLGVDASRVRLLFNMVEDPSTVALAFAVLLEFLGQQPIARADTRCTLGLNEIYQRVKGSGLDIAAWARDETDYKAQIAQAASTQEKIAVAQRLATCRLARGILPELDACFAALDLPARAVARPALLPAG